MEKLLLFQLAAPLGAFGGVAVGERRETATRPAHSALAGLLGAALGLERADPRQPAFARGLAFAVRKDRLGPLLADYHTAQSPPARKGKTWATRREELAGDVNTILSRRDYRTDCAFTIACRALGTSLFGVDAMAEALRRPVFALYLGRKSCPLGLPPDPEIVEAATLQSAFATYDSGRRRPKVFDGFFESGGEISFDAAFLSLVGEKQSVGARRDVVIDRKLWRFDLRDEFILAGKAAP